MVDKCNLSELKALLHDYIDNNTDVSLSDLIDFKQILSDINNIITLKTTQLFAKELLKNHIISFKQYKTIIDRTDNNSANANGYDVEFCGNICNNVNGIVAEIKCNIPVKGNVFGAAQIQGIRNDIHHLINGKHKSKIKDTANYYKFMGILNVAGAESAMTKIIDSYPNGRVVKFEKINGSKLSVNNVYVTYINIK